MRELDFFKFLAVHTYNNDIKWVLSSKSIFDEGYNIDRITCLKYGNIELQKELYFIGKVCSSYTTREIKDIVNNIFNHVCKREKLLDESFKIINEEMKKDKNND